METKIIQYNFSKSEIEALNKITSYFLKNRRDGERVEKIEVDEMRGCVQLITNQKNLIRCWALGIPQIEYFEGTELQKS